MSAAGRAALFVLLALVVEPGLAACAQKASPRVESSGPPPAASPFRSTRTYEAVAPPVRVRIPDARVNSGLQRLGRVANGEMKVPSRADIAGWYAQGPRPGQAGPAVIIGHVDSKYGPAVFFHLATLRPGAKVYVDRTDGSTASFRVTRVARVPKNRFPTDLVYAPTLEASLRLVTCGGSIDRQTGHYKDNVVVFTVPV